MVSSMPRVSLGDVAHEVKQRAPEGAACPSVGLEHLDPDEIELSRWDEGGNSTFTKSFSRGQVLFGRRRAYLRKAAVAPFDGVCSGDITVIEARETLSPRLLPFIVQTRPCSSMPQQTLRAPSRLASSGKGSRSSNSTSPNVTNKRSLPTCSGQRKIREGITSSCSRSAMTSSNHNLATGGARHDKV